MAVNSRARPRCERDRVHARVVIVGVAATLLAAITPARADLAGHVVDAQSGDPLAGAKVTVRGVGEAITGADGAFTVAGGDGATVTVVAAHAGHFHGWTETSGPRTDLVLALDAVPVEDDPAYVFKSPLSCGNCHGEQLDDWDGSPMANAGRNTWVYDLYDGTGTPGGAGGFVYTRDAAQAEENPASECASCHQPLGWAASPYGALEPIGSGSSAVAHGVSCDLCHRIAEIDVSRPSFPGLWPGVVRLARPSSAMTPVQFGVLGDATFTQAMQMRPAYQPQLVADVCAACHQDKNDPDGDGDFEEDDGVISEPTYLEWKASAYADPESPSYATCVDCHMPPRDDLTSACTVAPPTPARAAGTIRSHRIEGTTAPFLENAVTLELDARVEAGAIVVDATITNDQTGHHVPTGVTIRNMILLVEAFDMHGAPLASSGEQVIDDLGGVGDPAEGYWAGLPGKLYAKVPADREGHAPVFYTEAASLAWDNRIPAGERDTTHYAFALPEHAGPVQVTARVVYRRSFRAVVDAKGWTTDGHGAPLADVQAPDFGHVMERAEVEVEVGEEDLADDDAGGCCSSGRGGALGAAVLALAVALALRRRT